MHYWFPTRNHSDGACSSATKQSFFQDLKKGRININFGFDQKHVNLHVHSIKVQVLILQFITYRYMFERNISFPFQEIYFSLLLLASASLFSENSAAPSIPLIWWHLITTQLITYSW